MDPKTVFDIVVTLALTAVHLAVIVAVLVSERRQPTATLAWLLTVVFLPVVGVLLYLLVGVTHARRIRRLSAASTDRIDGLMERHALARKLESSGTIQLSPRGNAFKRLGRRLARTPASVGNKVQILENAAATYRSIILAIEEAKHHIHVEFFIIRPDETGIALRDRLTRRAREGLEVRVVYDDVGSYGLPGDFWRSLQRAGGRATAFNPVSPFRARLGRTNRVDFRNHRKIVVTDGKVGFTGGINVGTEYLGLVPEIGHWRDTHIRIEGPAVLSLQETFAEDWLTACGELLDDERYYPEPELPLPGEEIVQIVDSGPDREWSPMSRIYTQLIAQATERIFVATPYFVPSPPVEEALITAALRGVDVRLLVPGRPDHVVVNLASRSYYPRLASAGARIFEYERGFMHAKTMVVDSWIGTIGSTNMDMRSFHLNYELNAFVGGERFADALAHLFLEDLDHAAELDEHDLRPGISKRLIFNIARLLSPLL